MGEGTVLFIPKRGFKGQSTTLEAYNRDLGYLGDWLREYGLTIDKMTAAHWDQFIDDRGWGWSTEKRALSAARYWLRNCRKQNRMQRLWARAFGEHPLFNVEWPTGESKPQRTLTLSQRNELIEAAKTMRNPKRDTAIIRLLWDIGGAQVRDSRRSLGEDEPGSPRDLATHQS